ncbi:MAG: hypothetical protein FAF03_02795 [Epsilonproteobacteria bacterium]|nr:hypothetical protein [Campylobacterota bacterium]
MHKIFLIRLYRKIAILLVIVPSLSMADMNMTTDTFDCVVIPSNVADLGSNDRGVIHRIMVDRNDFVEKGAVIAVLDDEVEQATVALASKQASDISEISL